MGIAIVNQRLIYVRERSDSDAKVKRIEDELAIFNKAREGQDSRELEMMGSLSDKIDKLIGSVENRNKENENDYPTHN